MLKEKKKPGVVLNYEMQQLKRKPKCVLIDQIQNHSAVSFVTYV